MAERNIEHTPAQEALLQKLLGLIEQGQLKKSQAGAAFGCSQPLGSRIINHHARMTQRREDALRDYLGKLGVIAAHEARPRIAGLAASMTAFDEVVLDAVSEVMQTMHRLQSRLGRGGRP